MVFSVMYLAIEKLMSFTPSFSAIERFDDDMYLMKKAYDECRRGKAEKIGEYFVIEVRSHPPETKTHTKRKFALDRECKIKLIIY